MLCYAVQYKRLRVVARRVIKIARRNSWRRFCEMIGPERHLWSAVHRMSGLYKRRPIPVLQNDGVR